MARARNIKPGFFFNEDLAALGMGAQILFAGLWCIADREGRLEDRPTRIKAQVMPYYDVDVDELLNLLSNNPTDENDEKFIIRYTAKGHKYIQITNFKRHQNPHKNEAPSVIPAPSEVASEKHSTSTVQAPDKDGSTPADSLFSDSLNPLTDSGFPIKDHNNNDNAREDESYPQDGSPDNPQATPAGAPVFDKESFLNYHRQASQEIAAMRTGKLPQNKEPPKPEAPPGLDEYPEALKDYA